MPPALSTLVARCLEKSAGDRPQSADELLTALDAIATPSGGMEPATATAPGARRARTRWVTIGVATAVITVALLAALPRFVNRNSDVLKPGRVTPVATSPALEMSPAISRDGRFVTYAAGSPGSSRIYLRQIDGQRPVLLSGELDGDHTRPAWSPDGSQIAFEAKGLIYVVPALGGAPRLFIGSGDWQRMVLVVSGARTMSPSWSPDGAHVAFSNAAGIFGLSGACDAARWEARHDQRLDSCQPEPRVDARRANGPVRLQSRRRARRVPATTRRRASARGFTTSRHDRPLAFTVSHDGEWIAYDSDRSGNADIYKVRIDGGEPIQLTKDPGNDFAPSWSPDDREIAFHSSRTGVRRIYIIGAEGNNEQQVTSEGPDVYAPHWSPDGTRLVFMTNFGPDRGDAVITRRPDGTWSPPRRITLPEHQATWARWSPDGRWLAYPMLVRDGSSVAAIQPAEGGPARIIVRPDSTIGSVAWVTWGRDPNVLYYCAQTLGGRTSFWSVPTIGGAPRLLFTDDDAHRISRFDFATDGNRLFLNFAADESDVYIVELRR